MNMKQLLITQKSNILKMANGGNLFVKYEPIPIPIKEDLVNIFESKPIENKELEVEEEDTKTYTPTFQTAGVGSGLSFIKQLNLEPTQETKPKESPVTGTKEFNNAFDKVETKIPEIRKYRDFLTKLAARESSFNPKAKAGNSSGTALGYFQFMPFNRTGISEQTFANDPELQIEMAYDLVNRFKNSFDNTDFVKAKNKGYSESAIIAGAWLGGPQGVKRFLNTGVASSDRLGTSVKNYMDKFNNII